MPSGQTIHDLLPISGSQVTTDNTLKALRAAISESWPQIKVPKYAASAGTFSATTFTYSLSALTDLTEYGVIRVYVDPDSASDGPTIGKREWRQYKDNSGNWQLEFSADITNKHSGKDFHVLYPAKTADISAIGDSIELPQNYLIYYCAWWYALYGLSEPESGRGTYTDRALMWQDAWRNALRENETPGFDAPYWHGADKMFGQRGHVDNPTGRYP